MITMQFKNKHRLNYQIKSSKVRLVFNNVQMGIVSIEDARKLAQEKALDLVEIAPNASPPVCYIINYNKYLYDQKIKQKKQQKDDLKEIKFKSCIQEHDLNIKIKQAKTFLEKNKKVQITVRFKSFRDLGHKDIGFNLLNKFIENLKEVGTLEKEVLMSSNNIICRLIPKKNI